jgi:hypothetical protein
MVLEMQKRTVERVISGQRLKGTSAIPELVPKKSSGSYKLILSLLHANQHSTTSKSQAQLSEAVGGLNADS